MSKKEKSADAHGSLLLVAEFTGDCEAWKGATNELVDVAVNVFDRKGSDSESNGFRCVGTSMLLKLLVDLWPRAKVGCEIGESIREVCSCGEKASLRVRDFLCRRSSEGGWIGGAAMTGEATISPQSSSSFVVDAIVVGSTGAVSFDVIRVCGPLTSVDFFD